MKIPTILFLLFISSPSFSQTFLKDYKEFKTTQFKSQKNNKKTNKRVLRFLASQITQLDTIFDSYLKRKKFDFNTADSLKIIRQSSIESGLSDYIIWSSKDTISYGELWLVNPGYSIKKIIEYNSLFDTTWYGRGLKKVDSRDSLMTLVNNHDFTTAQKLSVENPVYDGTRSTIILAIKINEKYLIKEYYLKPSEISGKIRGR